jgi:hypothetical protein
MRLLKVPKNFRLVKPAFAQFRLARLQPDLSILSKAWANFPWLFLPLRAVVPLSRRAELAMQDLGS